MYWYCLGGAVLFGATVRFTWMLHLVPGNVPITYSSMRSVYIILISVSDMMILSLSSVTFGVLFDFFFFETLFVLFTDPSHFINYSHIH